MQNVAIIGAGITGLTVADGLRDRARVTVFEKSFGSGGRMATRRVGMLEVKPFYIDHGAPWVHPEREPFREAIGRFAGKGRAVAWERFEGRTGFVGLPHMNTMLDDVADGLDLRFHARVDRIVRQDGWWLQMAPHDVEGGLQRGEVGPFDRVVVCVPADQTVRLIDDPVMRRAMEAVEVDPCWTLLLADQALPDGPAVQRSPNETFAVITRPSRKPMRDGPDTLVAHTTATFAREYLELDRDTVHEVLLGALPFDPPLRPIYASTHRWRYSQTRTALGEPFLANDDRTLICAGDWCLGPYVEHGYESARAVLQELG